MHLPTRPTFQATNGPPQAQTAQLGNTRAMRNTTPLQLSSPPPTRSHPHALRAQQTRWQGGRDEGREITDLVLRRTDFHHGFRHFLSLLRLRPLKMVSRGACVVRAGMSACSSACIRARARAFRQPTSMSRGSERCMLWGWIMVGRARRGSCECACTGRGLCADGLNHVQGLNARG
jgi:hypothetical protein